MASHEAGALHGQLGHRGPEWLSPPADSNALVGSLWPGNVVKGADGVLRAAGVSAAAIAEEFGTPAYVVDEDDFRTRARGFRDAFDGADVYYAGKAFLCGAVAGWVMEEGLNLDVCSGGELAVAVRAGVAGDRIGFHGNNKSDAELIRAIDVGVRLVIVDSFGEIERLSALASRRRTPVSVLVRVTAGVEAHTHEYIATAHEDQKFGFSISEGDALEAARRVAEDPMLELRGLHSHIGSQIFDTSGFEVATRRVLALHLRVRDELGIAMPELNLGGGFGIAYTTKDDPQTPRRLAEGIMHIVARECRALEVAVPHLSVEPGRAIAGPSTFTLYEVGTVKRVALDAGDSRLYVSVDGGMSDNIRTALYGADFSCTLASRRSGAGVTLGRVVGKHCESGDVVVNHEFVADDVAPGDLLAVPGTGAYCRSMASNYNHLPRPAVVAVKDGKARLVVRRETEEDLLSLDVG
jgi:diaminopimelate decarboxylase